MYLHVLNTAMIAAIQLLKQHTLTIEMVIVLGNTEQKGRQKYLDSDYCLPRLLLFASILLKPFLCFIGRQIF